MEQYEGFFCETVLCSMWAGFAVVTGNFLLKIIYYLPLTLKIIHTKCMIFKVKVKEKNEQEGVSWLYEELIKICQGYFILISLSSNYSLIIHRYMVASLTWNVIKVNVANLYPINTLSNNLYCKLNFI